MSFSGARWLWYAVGVRAGGTGLGGRDFDHEKHEIHENFEVVVVGILGSCKGEGK